jgi:hypothetical protein
MPDPLCTGTLTITTSSEEGQWTESYHIQGGPLQAAKALLGMLESHPYGDMQVMVVAWEWRQDLAAKEST